MGPRDRGAASHPVIHEGVVWVEGCLVARFERLRAKVDQFLTWGHALQRGVRPAAFKSARENAAFLGSVHVLHTDI